MLKLYGFHNGSPKKDLIQYLGVKKGLISLVTKQANFTAPSLSVTPSYVV